MHTVVLHLWEGKTTGQFPVPTHLNQMISWFCLLGQLSTSWESKVPSLSLKGKYRSSYASHLMIFWLRLLVQLSTTWESKVPCPALKGKYGSSHISPNDLLVLSVSAAVYNMEEQGSLSWLKGKVWQFPRI